MRTESYGDFSAKVHQKFNHQRVPLSGSMEISRRCPLACAHCYNNLPMGDALARRAELSYQEYCRLLDEIVDAGCLWLLFTGGEIFARADFLDIYTYAKKKGLLITLFTNGTLITERIANHLSRWRPFAIEITLYGRTKSTYERLTRVPGSFDQCMRGIRLLLERRLPLKLKTVAVTINKDEIWKMRDFVEQELKVEFKFDSMINPRIDCSQSPLAVRLKPEEIVRLDLQDPRRIDEWKKLAELLPQPPTPSDQVYQCGGGVNSFAINPYGKMSICVLSQMDLYDLRRGSFKEGWESFLFKVRSKKITKITKCTSCALKSMCGMCPANGELHQGDAEAPIDFLCETAHLRAYGLGLSVPPHGECENCEGGSHYREVTEKAALLRRENLVPEQTTTLNEMEIVSVPPLPSAKSAACSGGCSSCSSAQRQ